MASAWFDAWGEAWGDSWGATSGAQSITGVGDVESTAAVGAPFVNKRLHYNQAPIPLEEQPEVKPHRIIGVGRVFSSASVGSPTVRWDQDTLAFLLMAA